MNCAGHSFLFLIVLGLILSGLSPSLTAHCDGNKHGPGHPHCEGGEEPPPPPPPVVGCADVPGSGYFPAMAYTKQIVTGKRRKQVTTTDIYLADATGTCSVSVYSSTSHEPLHLDFALGEPDTNGVITGTLVYKTSGYPDTVQLLTLETQSGEILTALPLEPTQLLAAPANSLALSLDGEQLYVATEEPGSGSVDWIGKISQVDLTACQVNCTATVLASFNDEGVEWLSTSASGQRIYYSSHRRVPDIYQVALIENQGGSWSAPIDIVSSTDSGYTNVKFYDTSVTQWDVNGAGPVDALAVTYESPYAFGDGDFVLDILDVSTATATPAGSSCFATSTCSSISSDAAPGVQAKQASFTAYPSNPGLSNPPNILIGEWLFRPDGAGVIELDPDVPVTNTLPLNDVQYVVPAK